MSEKGLYSLGFLKTTVETPCLPAKFETRAAHCDRTSIISKATLGPCHARASGFDVRAGLVVQAGQRDRLERLAVLTPRPRVNLILCHGVLAPRAAWRSAMVVATADALMPPTGHHPASLTVMRAVSPGRRV